MEMLTFPLIYDRGIPIYHQLYSFIKAEIQSGKIPYNAKLPSKRKLAAYLKVSLNTIQAAYDQLMEEGYISSLEKKGFYVNKIDHLQKLDINLKNELSERASDRKEVRFDFSYHGVDIPSFPFDIWRKLMKEIWNEYDKELLIPGNSLGCARLRKALADYLHQSRGVHCSEDQIVVSSGTELLFQILIQLLDRNTVYGIENPGYEKLNQLFTANRANFTIIHIDSHGMIPEEIQKSNANVLCIAPAHQFPSGEIMPINRRIQLLNWTNEANGRYLIEDDYDSEFKYSGKPIPALQGLDSNEKVIYMGSLSKSISPTLRVSYMVLPYHLMQQYQERLSYILCPVPIIEQKALCLFIENGYFERHLNRMRTIYKKKREILVKSILGMSRSIEIMGADAGLHLLLRITNGMTEDQLIAAALSCGVKTYGISKYYFDKAFIDPIPIVLLGYASITEEDIPKAAENLKEAWFPSNNT